MVPVDPGARIGLVAGAPLSNPRGSDLRFHKHDRRSQGEVFFHQYSLSHSSLGSLECNAVKECKWSLSELSYKTNALLLICICDRHSRLAVFRISRRPSAACMQLFDSLAAVEELECVQTDP